MKLLAAVASLFGIAFIGCLVWAITTVGDLNETRELLASTRTELAVKTAELEETEDRLADTTDELVSTVKDLSETEDALNDTIRELSEAETELVTTRSQLSRAESSLTSTERELETAREDLKTATDTLTGLGITLSKSEQCYDVKLVDNPEAEDPTWEELVTFLGVDQTDKNRYVKDVYDCSQFSRDIHNNAEVAGIRAAEVHVAWSNSETAHALNAFLTTDYGLVYIDCTGYDLSARVKVGKTFRGITIHRITAVNVRNDVWWDNLDTYYYMSAGAAGEAKTGSIKIFW